MVFLKGLEKFGFLGGKVLNLAILLTRLYFISDILFILCFCEYTVAW